MEFDTDPDAAADTRRRVFDMVATATGWRSPACTCTANDVRFTPESGHRLAIGLDAANVRFGSWLFQNVLP
jgi:hypothetical protein